MYKIRYNKTYLYSSMQKEGVAFEVSEYPAAVPVRIAIFFFLKADVIEMVLIMYEDIHPVHSFIN